MSVLDNLDQRLTQAGKQAADSVMQSGEIEAEKNRLQQYYAAIGKLYIQRSGQEIPVEYKQMYDQILMLESRAAELNAQERNNEGSGGIKCPNCQIVLPAGAAFCNHCGQRVTEPQPQPQQQETGRRTGQMPHANDTNPVNLQQSNSNPQGRVSPQSVTGGAQVGNNIYAQFQGYFPNLTEEQLPAKFKPIRAWGYFGWTILFTIPLIGWILAAIKAFGNTENINLRNFARSMFCYVIILLILWLLVAGVAGCTAGMMW